MTTLIMIHLILFIIGITLSALFSGFENGMVSIRKARLDHAVSQGSLLARLIKRMLNRPSSMLATILLGNNLSNCLAAVYFGKFFSEVFNNNSMMLQVISAAVLTIIMLIFGEITPKVWFRQRPFELCRLGVLPIFFFYIITYPFVLIMTAAVTLMNKFIAKGGGDVILMREDFCVMLRESVEEGMLNQEDQLLLENSLGFNKQTACELMVARDDVIAFNAEMTLADAVAKSKETGVARFPVYEPGREDRWTGVFSVYDAVFLVPQRDWPETPIRSHLRPVTSIDESTGVADVLQCSRLNSCPLLVVTNSDNGQLGIITAEDAVRPLFGSIKL